MVASRLAQRHVGILKPGRKTRDREFKGFGIRILPSGRKRHCLHSLADGQRLWHAIGDATDITLACAHSRAKAQLVTRLHGEEAEVAGYSNIKTTPRYALLARGSLHEAAASVLRHK